MARRGENVYKRKDGRWEGRILKPDGKYCYVYAKTYKEVKEKQKNYQEHLKLREVKGTTALSTATELFEFWLKNHVFDRVKPSTYENYHYCIEKHVIPFFEYGSNRYITETTVGVFEKTIKDNPFLSESYKRKILTIFKTALKEILRGSADYSSILERIKLPKTKNSAAQVFSIKEQRLVENAVMEFNDRRALGILLCFYSGIRLGELCALKWSDIDLEAGTMAIMRTVSRISTFQCSNTKTALLVGTPKSQKAVRKIPLPKFLLNLTGESTAFPFRENAYVLSGLSTPIDPRTYQKIYKKVLAKAGVKDRKFHAIRHTFATRSLELGVDIKTLSEILGHSNVSITLNIYAHSFIEQKRIAIDKLNEMHLAFNGIKPFAVTPSVMLS